jgi:hypothetical protein
MLQNPTLTPNSLLPSIFKPFWRLCPKFSLSFVSNEISVAMPEQQISAPLIQYALLFPGFTVITTYRKLLNKKKHRGMTSVIPVNKYNNLNTNPKSEC